LRICRLRIERTYRLDALGTVTVTAAALIYANAHIARTAFMAVARRIGAHQTGTPHSHERNPAASAAAPETDPWLQTMTAEEPQSITARQCAMP
jgi:hypothetical protein